MDGASSSQSRGVKVMLLVPFVPAVVVVLVPRFCLLFWVCVRVPPREEEEEEEPNLLLLAV